MRRLDRWLGLAIAVLGVAVVWSSSAFPNVPGQKLGAAFLPMLVGAGLTFCGLALVLRAWRPGAGVAVAQPVAQPRAAEHAGSSAVIIGMVIVYIVAAERVGFLLIAPLCLVVIFRAFRVSWRAAILWAVFGTLLVHLAFYKLLRVPLPWGVLRPFY